MSARRVIGVGTPVHVNGVSGYTITMLNDIEEVVLVTDSNGKEGLLSFREVDELAQMFLGDVR